MKFQTLYLLSLGILFLGCQPKLQTADLEDDPYLWLEEVEGEKAIEWVKTKNESSTSILGELALFEPILQKNIEIRNSDDRIAMPRIVGTDIYNLWKDEDNPRGIWRRMSIEDYIQNKTNWETLIDLDQLSKDENKLWVFKEADWLAPKNDRCLVYLSDGGGDAIYIREFDLITKSFIKDGFYLPESKGGANYADENTIYVMTDFGEGTMTTSGYPRIVKSWKRGTGLTEATTLLECDTTDMGIFMGTLLSDGKQYDLIFKMKTFYSTELFIVRDGKAVKFDIPEDAELKGIFENQMILAVKSDWNINDEVFNSGSLVSFDIDDYLSGTRKVQTLYQPDEKSSIYDVATTKDFVLVNSLQNVQNKLLQYQLKDGKWLAEEIELPDFGSLEIISSSEYSNDYFITYENFLTPTTLYHGNETNLTINKSMPDFFDSEGLVIKQNYAVSKDGTQIPYFIVSKEGLEQNGKQPTLIYGYGGFEISEIPFYSATIGASWLERGGVFVVANIRGGGEFGPAWHQAALKEKRQNAYDDFSAVAEDLIGKKITSPEHLGIYGGSNGGLLVGVAFTQRPDLYNAVVCAVPLLDMKRYSHLLAGASWMGEYGDPDIPEEWEYIKKYSPYHNLSKDAEYPEVLFITSTKDDRVHPGHARKMVAKMESMGHKVFYYETMEGGHGAATTNEQRAYFDAMIYTYLHKQLGGE